MSKKTAEEVLAQISRVVDAAKAIGARAAFISVLLPDMATVPLQKHIAALNKEARASITVHLLTITQLQEPEDPTSRWLGIRKFLPQRIKRVRRKSGTKPKTRRIDFWEW